MTSITLPQGWTAVHREIAERLPDNLRDAPFYKNFVSVSYLKKFVARVDREGIKTIGQFVAAGTKQVFARVPTSFGNQRRARNHLEAFGIEDMLPDEIRYGRVGLASMFAKDRTLDRTIENMANHGILLVADAAVLSPPQLLHLVRTRGDEKASYENRSRLRGRITTKFAELGVHQPVPV